MPETLLFGDLHRLGVEISIITRTINGCIYIHPYFKFYDLRSDRESPTVNPLYINLGFDKDFILTRYSEGMQNILYVSNVFHISYYFILNFRLYLCVIMLTHNELLQNQPMQPFGSLYSSM
jgi:hypothetical protein